ncbi:MAG: MarR family transcriptional regulator [Candidatus Zixiibacteriota bacterium]
MKYQGRPNAPALIREVNRCWLSAKYTAKKLLAKYNIDLTFEQLVILFILDEKDGQNLRDLAERADRERTTISRMIDGLERRNLVIRVPDKTDGRNKLVYLTHVGREMTEQVQVHAEEFDQMAYKDITKEEIAETTRILNKIIANLGFEEI